MVNTRFGEHSPNAIFTARTVRQIRLSHLCDGLPTTELAKIYGSSPSAISRIVRFISYSHQDDDLRAVPRPVHKGGKNYHQPKGAEKTDPSQPKKPAATCRQCIHLTKEGRCGLEFPECLRSAYKEAAKCSAFVQTQSKAGAASDV